MRPYDTGRLPRTALEFRSASVVFWAATTRARDAPPLPAPPQAWLRVALGYHTVAQVAVGWMVGGGSAAAWHSWGHRRVLPQVLQQPELQVQTLRVVWEGCVMALWPIGSHPVLC